MASFMAFCLIFFQVYLCNTKKYSKFAGCYQEYKILYN